VRSPVGHQASNPRANPENPDNQLKDFGKFEARREAAQPSPADFADLP
jgi:hypothetical protein